MPLPYIKDHKERSRILRNNMTPAERALWQRIRRKQIHGVQFYRQKPIGPYVVDFYCAKAQLVVEVDGGQHWEPGHAAQDRQRDAEMAQLGLAVLRYSNREIMSQLDLVVEHIHSVVGERLTEAGRGGGSSSPL